MGAPSDKEPEIGEIVAFWPQGAGESPRDAHYRAQRWSHVLSWQIDRLYASRRHAMESHEQVLAARHYPDEARWPFFEMDADAHFALVAARQLLRALRSFDGNDRLPEGLTNAQVRDVRDALEHWDTPGGSEASKRLARQGASATSHKWSTAGPGLLGDLVADTVLARWALEVYDELLRWDPYDGWKEHRRSAAYPDVVGQSARWARGWPRQTGTGRSANTAIRPRMAAASLWFSGHREIATYVRGRHEPEHS